MTDLNDIQSDLHQFAAAACKEWTVDACGVLRDGRPIPALVHRDAYDRDDPRPRVLVIGGLTDGAWADTVVSAIRSSDCLAGGKVVLSLAHSGVKAAGADSERSFPPDGGYFDHPTDAQSRYLWRWINYLAPDAVVEARLSETSNPPAQGESSALLPGELSHLGFEEGSLLWALSLGKGDAVGKITCLSVTAPKDDFAERLGRIFSSIGKEGLERSPARRALAARRERSAGEVARILAGAYGYTLDPVVYTQGVAISGRLLCAERGLVDGDTIAEVQRLVEPLVADADSYFATNPDGASLAGLIWAYDLARLTADSRYAGLAIAAAERFEPSDRGLPPTPADADFRVEDMYFASAVLGRAARLTVRRRHIGLLCRYMLDCIASGVQREDDLFDHCLGSRFPWGRGNGFAAFGMSAALTWIPVARLEHGAVARAHMSHLTALAANAAPSGMQRQLTNTPGSYEELSATCMLGIALARGLRLGWLDDSFRPSLRLTWDAVNQRIGDDGGLVDVCTGTGPQSSAQEYLDRPAVSGFDDRGGSMALSFALEMDAIDSANR